MAQTVRVQVNKIIPPHRPGTVVSVVVDDKGVPVDLHWRRRFQDAKVDQCCEVLAEKAKGKSGASTKGSEE